MTCSCKWTYEKTAGSCAKVEPSEDTLSLYPAATSVMEVLAMAVLYIAKDIVGMVVTPTLCSRVTTPLDNDRH